MRQCASNTMQSSSKDEINVEVHNIEKKKTEELICIDISIPRHNDQPKGPAIYSNLELLLKSLKPPLSTHMFLSSRL